MAVHKGREGYITIPYGFYTDRRVARRLAKKAAETVVRKATEIIARKVAEMGTAPNKVKGPWEEDYWQKCDDGQWYYFRYGCRIRPATYKESHLMNSLGRVDELEPEMKMVRQALDIAETSNISAGEAMGLLRSAIDLSCKLHMLGIDNWDLKFYRR